MKRIFIIAAAVLLSCSHPANKKEGPALPELRSAFVNPPQSAKPLVYWLWMDGNIDKDGIRKDLEWMTRVGIGGFHAWNHENPSPQVVEKRVSYMSPEWKDAFRFAINLADSLGLEAGVMSSSGHLHSGGPWVTPANAMKKIVWREMPVEGGRHFHGKLPAPFTTSGHYQDLPLVALGMDYDRPEEAYYEDIAVVAVELTDNTRSLTELGAELSTSGGEGFSVEQLSNDSFNDWGRLDAVPGGFGWIQYAFPEPQTFRALTIVYPKARHRGHSVPEFCQDSLQVSDDGVDFRTVFGIPVGSCEVQTMSFEPLTAKYFRLKHKNPESFFHYTMIHRNPDPKFSLIPEFRLYTENRINHAEEKAAFAAAHDIRDYPTPDDPEGIGIGRVEVITDAMKDGILDWDVPEGRWVIYRFGASLTGKNNHPELREASGMECDKLDPDAWLGNFRNHLDRIRDAAGGMLGDRGVVNLNLDSYEGGAENWTARMREEFSRRRGYDMIPWLPVIAGNVVRDAGHSERFLLDFRQTIAELISENYSRLTRLLQDEYGMNGCFVESHECGRVFTMDGMSVKKNALYPQAACWVPSKVGPQDRVFEAMADMKESSSVAHIYGQNRASTESLTSIGLAQQAYTYCPENLKKVMDRQFACGINRMVIHYSCHVPVEKYPCLGMGVYGQWFDRTESWAEQAGAWVSYITRSCAMLQQGRDVADILWLYGDDTNITANYSHSHPEIPAGFRYDFSNPEALLERISIKGETLVTESGCCYRILCLDPTTEVLSDAACEKVDAIRAAGIPVVTPGKGLRRACRHLHRDMSGADSLAFVHRRMEGADIYWVSNPSSSRIKTDVFFRVRGRAAEIWNPETGEMKPASFRFAGGRTVVSLDLAKDDAVFVVFAGNAGFGRRIRSAREISRIAVEGPWNLEFQQGRGAPESVVFPVLSRWDESDDEGIKYFSGTCSYRNTFVLDSLQAGHRLELSLGTVKNLADVYVNGNFVRTLWRPPFKTDISGFVRPGENELEIRVTNLWVNRLIGDAQPGVTPVAYSYLKFYEAGDALLPSGLLGPVELIQKTGR